MISKVPTRERCQICGKESPISFAVPDKIWKTAMHVSWHDSIVCLLCFIDRADAQLLRWEYELRLFPTSRISQLEECGIDISQIKRELTGDYKG